MTAPVDADRERLRFLVGVVRLEARYLAQTDGRLFARAMDAARVSHLPDTPDLSEQVDAFVARISRLQDGVADKLLPALLRWLAEPVGPTIDNLDRAERFGWLESAEQWLACRQLRNRLVHEYVRDPERLAQALTDAHATVGLLVQTANRLAAEAERRLGA